MHGDRISYSLYLVHVPVLEVFWTAMSTFPALRPGRPLWFAGVVLPPVVVVLLAPAWPRPRSRQGPPASDGPTLDTRRGG